MSISASPGPPTASSPRAGRATPRPSRVALGLLLLAGGAAFLLQAATPRLALLWLLGAGLGAVLLLASFGFAGAFRRLLGEGRGSGFRAVLLLVAANALVFLPLLEAGEALGQPVRGYVFPVGWALLVGAFLFGVGMQVAGGCGSGTLYTAGGGSPRMLAALAGFVAGATLAAWQSPLWEEWPALEPVSLPATLGLWPALATTLLALAAAWAWSVARERRRHGAAEAVPAPKLWGVALLTALGLLTLLVAGRPWAITAAFPLWGSKLVEAAGWDDPSFWSFWEDPTRVEAYLRPIWLDRITVMDLGLMAGAFAAAALAARPLGRWPGGRALLEGAGGGVLLGIGSVLASGCNISAFLAGIASGSLHGWVWIGPALVGNALGLLLRARLDRRAED